MKDKMQYLPIGMCIGISVGLAIGAAMDNIPVFMSVGLCIGMSIGALIDAKNRNQSEADTQTNDDEMNQKTDL